MKKTIRLLFVFCLIFVLCSSLLAGCDFLSEDDVERYNDELTSATGKWFLVDDTDTYFEFDGSKNVMTFNYFEDGVRKYDGKFRAVYRGLGDDVITPMTYVITRSDKAKEDWVNCYVENFKENFTQFTIMNIEEDLGMIDASLYTHVYRISELPYKMGTYILEGNEYKEDSNNYKYANEFYIPSGTYSLSSGESFAFLVTKPTTTELFQYKNGDVVVEGTYRMAQDKKTIYLYIEHDQYSKVTNADKERYDTTFDIYYPPDIYLRGDFSNSEYIVINDLYHHGESPIKIPDSAWIFGNYVKN